MCSFNDCPSFYRWEGRFGRLVNEADRERRLHARYVGEARSERRKALRAWRDCDRGANPNSRNELSASGNVKGKG